MCNSKSKQVDNLCNLIKAKPIFNILNLPESFLTPRIARARPIVIMNRQGNPIAHAILSSNLQIILVFVLRDLAGRQKMVGVATDGQNFLLAAKLCQIVVVADVMPSF